MTYLQVPGSGAAPVSVSNSGGGGGFAGGAIYFPAVTLNRIGRWIVIASFTINAGGHPNGDNWPTAQILVNGGAVINLGAFDIANQTGSATTYTFAGLVTANAVSDTSQLWISPAPGTGTYASSTITAYFVPTPTYPR